MHLTHLDTTGEGHRSREVSGPRRQAYVHLDPGLDLDGLLSSFATAPDGAPTGHPPAPTGHAPGSTRR